MTEADDVAEAINLLRKAESNLLKHKHYVKECNKLEDIQEKLTSELQEICG